MSGILADRLELWGFERGYCLFSDASLGFGFILSPIDVSCRSDEAVNDFTQGLRRFLNGLPSGIDVQFVQDIDAGAEGSLTGFEALGKDSKGELAGALSRGRLDHLRGQDERGELPQHGLRLFVRRPMEQSLVPKKGLFGSSRKFEAVSSERLQREIASIEGLEAQVASSLASAGFKPTRLDDCEILDLVYRQWNPGRNEGRPPHDPEDVRDTLLFTDVGIDLKGFTIGPFHHRILSMKLLPEKTFASMASVLRELPFASRVFMSIQVPDQDKEIEALKSQRRIAFSLARGKKEGVDDIESESKLTDVESLLEELIAQGEKVFHVSLTIVLRGEDEAELDNQVSEALGLFRELAGAEGLQETLAAFDIFSQVSLPNARSKERAKRMKTSTLADLLPAYGPWCGHEKPSVLLRSRLGSLISIDPFDKSLSNYNHVVSGGSGSGKSFLTNLFLLQLLKENPRIVIIDIGGSYQKLCEHLGGQYVSLGVDADFAINPFDLASGDTQPSPTKVKFLTGLVELMVKEEGSPALPRYERAEIERHIKEVYLREKAPTLSHLQEDLGSSSDKLISRLGSILRPWCGDTLYGRTVDRPTTLALNSPVVCFDLKGMESYPDLQAVMLFLITDFIWREFEANRSQQKFLVFDECWRLLENESGSGFIAEVFRTFRKYYAGVIAISQNMDDFAKSKVSEAILSNVSFRWILSQKGANQERLQEVLQLNESEMALVASLQQKRGLYSEAFLMAGEDRSVVSVEPTPLEYWIATTDPRDLRAIQERGGSSLETLEALSTEYPRGVAAHGGTE